MIMCYSNKQRNIVIWFQFLDRPYNFFSATALASIFSLGGYFYKCLHVVLQDCTLESIFLKRSAQLFGGIHVFVFCCIVKFF